VGREGLETSLFIWTAVQATDDGVRPLVGAALGLLTAVLLGWLFYRGALRINLAKFFTWTGAMLVVVAAGVLAYGVHDLQEAGWVPGLGSRAFDISTTIPPDSWYGTLLKGVFNFQPDPTWLQVTVWVLYLVPTMFLFLAPGRVAAPTTTPTAPKEPQPDDSQVPDAPVALADGGGTVDADGGDDDRVRDGARGAGARTGGDEG
jgi:high-affinity iron transporter